MIFCGLVTVIKAGLDTQILVGTVRVNMKKKKKKEKKKNHRGLESGLIWTLKLL